MDFPCFQPEGFANEERVKQDLLLSVQILKVWEIFKKGIPIS